MYNATAKSDLISIYKYFPPDQRKRSFVENNDNSSMHNHSGFSLHAEKRLKSRLDNFQAIIESAQYYNNDLITKIRLNKNVFTRKPVFLTLTVPEQQISDEQIKNNCLKPLLDNLKKSYGLVNYIWKAEAQARGSIHFHLVLDCFVNRDRILKFWFKYMDAAGCLGKYLSNNGPGYASSLVYIKLVDMNVLKHELTGYFKSDRDEKGNVLHKKEKTVLRNIDGNNWGSSDFLKYSPFTVFDVSLPFIADVQKRAKKVLPLKDSAGNPLGCVMLLREYFRIKNSAGRVVKRITKIAAMPSLFTDMFNLYHYEMAVICYLKEELPDYKLNYLYNNPNFNLVYSPKKETDFYLNSKKRYYGNY